VDGTITLELGHGGDPPQTVRVWVTIDEELVVEEEVQPAYEESARAGDDACGLCSHADIEFVAAPA